jgi:hypothetical protein
VNNELERDWKEAAMPKVLSRKLYGGLRKTTVKIAGIWAEI